MLLLRHIHIARRDQLASERQQLLNEMAAPHGEAWDTRQNVGKMATLTSALTENAAQDYQVDAEVQCATLRGVSNNNFPVSFVTGVALISILPSLLHLPWMFVLFLCCLSVHFNTHTQALCFSPDPFKLLKKASIPCKLCSRFAAILQVITIKQFALIMVHGFPYIPSTRKLLNAVEAVHADFARQHAPAIAASGTTMSNMRKLDCYLKSFEPDAQLSYIPFLQHDAKLNASMY